MAAAVLAIKRESMDEHNSNRGDGMDGEDAVAHNLNNIGYYSSDDMTSDSTGVVGDKNISLASYIPASKASPNQWANP